MTAHSGSDLQSHQLPVCSFGREPLALGISCNEKSLDPLKKVVFQFSTSTFFYQTSLFTPKYANSVLSTMFNYQLLMWNTEVHIKSCNYWSFALTDPEPSHVLLLHIAFAASQLLPKACSIPNPEPSRRLSTCLCREGVWVFLT